MEGGNLASLRKRAEAGDADAQYRLAMSCLGEDQAIRAEATKWLRAAAIQGQKHASINLSICCFAGLGTQIDLCEAARWYRVTAQDGNPHSQFKLAHILYAGGEEVRDLHEAARWIAALAHARNMDSGLQAVARSILAHLYLRGEGVAKDEGEAARWYRAAAEAGNPSAQNNWAMSLYKGVGVEANLPEALAWFQKAAAVHFAAKHAVGICLWLGRGTARNEVAAIRWFQAAAPGHPPAMFRLGVSFHQSAGCEQDDDRATQWLLQASDRGHQAARECLGPDWSTAPQIQIDAFERRRDDELEPAWLDPTETHFSLPCDYRR